MRFEGDCLALCYRRKLSGRLCLDPARGGRLFSCLAMSRRYKKRAARIALLTGYDIVSAAKRS